MDKKNSNVKGEKNAILFKVKLKKRLNSFFSFIRIDFSFFIMFVLAFFTKRIAEYFCFIISLFLHELSHYFVAKKLGYMAKRIRLSFFGAVLEGLDDFSLSDEIKVIIAGPFFNFIAIIVCYLMFWFYPESYNYLGELLSANISILIFNMLPVFPLDMGRLILAVMTKKLSRDNALAVTKKISFYFIIILFIIFLVSIFFNYAILFGLSVINLMSIFLSSSNETSYKRNIFALHKATLLKRGLPERNIYISKSVEKYELFRFIDDYHFFNFLFIDDNYNVVDMMSETELYKETGFLK